MAATPEAFILLRSHFIKTLATVNICQYILGIGDRHLSNFMVDLENGGLVPIDFGHAFHTATQVKTSHGISLHILYIYLMDTII